MGGTRVLPAALELTLISRIAVRAVTLPIFTSSLSIPQISDLSAQPGTEGLRSCKDACSQTYPENKNLQRPHPRCTASTACRNYPLGSGEISGSLTLRRRDLQARSLYPVRICPHGPCKKETNSPLHHPPMPAHMRIGGSSISPLRVSTFRSRCGVAPDTRTARGSSRPSSDEQHEAFLHQ
jgi:hypothetical protein